MHYLTSQIINSSMHSVIIACTITTLITIFTMYIYIASSKVQLSQQLHCSVSYRWGYRNSHMLLDPLPLSQTVTPSRTPTPLERDVLYGRPLIIIYLLRQYRFY